MKKERGWFVRGNRVRDRNGGDVCFMSPDPYYKMLPREVEMAHLISAAPDLLEALLAVNDAGYLEGGYGPTIDMVEAAIKKAEGK